MFRQSLGTESASLYLFISNSKDSGGYRRIKIIDPRDDSNQIDKSMSNLTSQGRKYESPSRLGQTGNTFIDKRPPTVTGVQVGYSPTDESQL